MFVRPVTRDIIDNQNLQGIRKGQDINPMNTYLITLTAVITVITLIILML